MSPVCRHRYSGGGQGLVFAGKPNQKIPVVTVDSDLKPNSFSAFPNRDFRLVGAVIDNGAGRTIGFPRLANMAAMQNQPMMSMEPEFLSTRFSSFNSTSNGFCRARGRPIGNMENMNIHGHGRLTKKTFRTIGGFRPAGQFLQRRPVARNQRLMSLINISEA